MSKRAIIGYQVSESRDEAFGTPFRHFTVVVYALKRRDSAKEFGEDPSDWNAERVRTVRAETGETVYFESSYFEDPIEIRWQGNVENGEASGPYYAPRITLALSSVSRLSSLVRGLILDGGCITAEAFLRHLEDRFKAFPIRTIREISSGWKREATETSLTPLAEAVR